MVIHLLVLRGSGTEQSAASLVQVRALQVKALVDEEVFLFGTERDRRLLRARLKAGHEAAGRFRKSLQTAEKRSLLVERFSGVATERSRNAERGTVAVALEECRRSRIPGGIAAGFESRTQTAAREGRCVRFANDQVLAAKGHNGAATVGFKERVMLFGGRTGERLEPVRKVRGSAVHRPLLHGVGHIACDTRIEGGTFVNGCNQLFADILGQVFAHGVDVEHVFAVEIHIHRTGRLDGRGRGLCDFVDGLFAVAYAHFEPHFFFHCHPRLRAGITFSSEKFEYGKKLGIKTEAGTRILHDLKQNVLQYCKINVYYYIIVKPVRRCMSKGRSFDSEATHLRSG